MCRLIIWSIFFFFSFAMSAQEHDWVADGSRALDWGEYEKAAGDYERAITSLRETGASATSILHVRISQATAFIKAENFRNAEIALRQAAAGDGVVEPLERAQLRNAWGALYLVQGKFAAAEIELKHAKEILDGLPQRGVDLVAVLQNLAVVEMRTGRYPESHRDFQLALALLDGNSDANASEIVRLWANLASLQYLMGRRPDAKLSLEQAIQLTEKAYGKSHPLLGDLLGSYAVVLDGLKNKGEAKRARKRAEAIRQSSLLPQSQQMTVDVREPRASADGVHLVIK